MSILLEALRKSEKSQRSREVPTIHSEVPSSPASRSLKSGILATLLVLTLIACGWFVWNQYRQPPETEQVTTAGQVAAGTGDSSTIAEQTSSANLPALDRSKSKSAGVNPQVSTGARSQKGTPRDTTGVTGARTPMESFKGSERKSRNSARRTDTVVTSGNPETHTNDDGTIPSAIQADGSVNSANESSTAPDKPYQPDAPELLGYWDLPDSIRANVPEITFSVLVYDKNPENRFVLINGERLTEGDAHQPGLIVKEIRRNGVVFSYRLYQFLIEN